MHPGTGLVPDVSSARWGQTFIEKLSQRCQRPEDPCQHPVDPCQRPEDPC